MESAHTCAGVRTFPIGSHRSRRVVGCLAVEGSLRASSCRSGLHGSHRILRLQEQGDLASRLGSWLRCVEGAVDDCGIDLGDLHDCGARNRGVGDGCCDGVGSSLAAGRQDSGCQFRHKGGSS